MESRNTPLGFAQRTLKNLDYIVGSFPANDVHVVAQTGNSLLGLIVFPLAKAAYKPYQNKKLSELKAEGWPSFQLKDWTCTTLGELLRHLRNAVAHGRWSFSSDDRNCDAVDLTVTLEGNGSAKIGCRDLQCFCRKLVELISESES